MIKWRSALDEHNKGYSLDLIDSEYALSFDHEMYSRYIDASVRFKDRVIEVMRRLYNNYR